MSADPTNTAGRSNAGPTDPVGDCAALVRRHDRDRYVAALVAPKPARGALLALYAFNLEIARVRETVSEPILGRMRLQWWRETLEAIRCGGAVRQHAVALALADAIRGHGLDPEPLAAMIDGREFDLEDRQPGTLDELVAYADATAGSLAVAALSVLGGAGADARAAARDAGTAWALSGLLRAVPFHAARRRVYLPCSEICGDAALGALFAGRGSDAAVRAAKAVAAAARERLARARSRRAAVPRDALSALLPAALIDRDLGALARARFDVFAVREEAPVVRQLRLMWAAFLGRY